MTILKINGADRQFPAGIPQTLSELLERLKDTREGFDYNLKDLFEVIPTMAPEDAPVVTAVADAIKDVLGVTATKVVSPGTYDQKHIDRIGKLSNCIAYGPGILTLAHQPDEYVEVQDMVDSAKVMAQALHTLLTGDVRG